MVFGQDATGDKIYWWENPAPAFGAAWTRREIKSGLGDKHHDQMFGDFDGDGKVELVSWNQRASKLLLFEIPDDPKTAGAWPMITAAPAKSNYEGFAKADIDGDGVMDIVGAGRWWKYDGQGGYTRSTIDPIMVFVRAAAAQLIPGGRPEVIFAPGDEDGNAYWYEWKDNAWHRTLLEYFYHGHTLDIVDFDGDGNLDILSGEMRMGREDCELRIYFGDGLGGFTKSILSVGQGIHEGKVADIDGDGDLDIVHKPFDHLTPRLLVWRNNIRTLTMNSWKAKLVDGALANHAVFVLYGDLDGDDRPDIVAGDSWYRNPGNLADAWPKNTIGSPLYNVAAVVDADADGDLDLLGTQGQGSQANADFAWAENNGQGQFVVRTNIQQASGDFLQGVAAARFGGPLSNLQIALSWHQGGQGVQTLTVPADPINQTWTWQKISSTSQDEDLSVGDIDLDGDPDLLLGTVWLENPGFQPHTLGQVSDLPGVEGARPSPDRNALADIDGDGDLDAVIGLENGRDVVWFQNPLPANPATGSWARYILGNAAGQGMSMDVADFDQDGDGDVVLGEHRGSQTNRVLIFENQVRSADQLTDWNVQVVDSQSVSTLDHHDGTQAVDLDGDGDLDLVSVGWTKKKVWLYENLAEKEAPSPNVDKPELFPNGGTFRAFCSVDINTTPGATIHYTLDGSKPTQSSPQYEGHLLLVDSGVLSARAFQSGVGSSTVTASFARLGDEYGFWRFDEGSGSTSRDDSPGANHGNLVNTRWETEGLLGTALEFDGVASHVDLGSLAAPQKEFTISSWIRPNKLNHLSHGDSRIISRASGFQEQDHFFMLSTILVGQEYRLRFRLKTNNQTSTLIASSGSIQLNQWSHAVATYDGQEMALYLNGVKVGSMPKTGDVDDDPSVSTWVGDQFPVGDRPFDGLIDDVRIYSQALSSQEISALTSHSQMAGIQRLGWPTPACTQTPRLEATRSPISNDPWFALAAAGMSPGAAGILLVSPTVDLSGPRILGVSLWPKLVDHITLGIVASDQGRLLVPIPLFGVPSGIQTHCQLLWANPPGCPGVGNEGFSGTEAIEITVQEDANAAPSHGVIQPLDR